MVLREEKAIGTVTFGDAYEGPPNCVHGGMVALTWDHVMALANMLINARGPTAWLHVDYKKPTPLYAPLRFEAWIDKVEGKKTALTRSKEELKKAALVAETKKKEEIAAAIVAKNTPPAEEVETAPVAEENAPEQESTPAAE